MLYVFRVDTGTMLQMDMNLALGTVAELKDAIDRFYHIPSEKQVLLVSGGECLELTARVCTYSAGTDTNPIFLFSKNSEGYCFLSPMVDSGTDGELEMKVAASLKLPSTYSTVEARVSLAQSLCDQSLNLLRDCERLVHDQHLQHLGWTAAVANLEDMAVFFRDKSLAFQKDYRTHLEVREENLAILRNFNTDLQTLARIPILPPLLASAISLSGIELATKINAMTLLEWISAKDNQSSLQAVAEQCASFLEQLDTSVLDSLVDNVDRALKVSGDENKKEIVGLTARLCGLEQLMLNARRLGQEQADLAQSFQKNQLRANDLRDVSILPDLCASHKKQLLVMLQNQTKLEDFRGRCQKAKEELSECIHDRLSWVALAQSEMLNVGSNLMIYQESLKRGRRHFLIVRQVQRAPEMYCLAVAEVVRRKRFSRAFLKWAKDLSNLLLATYNEETERRREFKVQFGGHFLEALFPGLEDDPPPFATESPEPFDTLLPDLTTEDMESLLETLPELALRVSWTELSSMAQMVLSKGHMEIKEDSKEEVPVEGRLLTVISEVGLDDRIDGTLRQDNAVKLREERDLESETDTDEFEKVSQIPLDKKIDGKGFKESVSDSVRQQIEAAGRLAVEVTSSLRAELAELQGQTVADKDYILGLARQIQLLIVRLTEGYVEELANLHARFTSSEAESETQITQLQKVIKDNEETIASCERETNLLRVEMEVRCRAEKERHEQMVADLNKNIDAMREEHVAALEKLEEDKRLLENLMAQQKIDNEAELKSAVLDAQTEGENRLRQATEEHIQAVAELQEKETALKDSIMRVERENEELEQRLVQTQLTAEVEMENRGKELEAEHARACVELEARLTQAHRVQLQEVTDRLTGEYKTELGSLRSRFRLMSITSMEKSPSDSSLEKIERGDMIELTNHEAILAQAKEDADIAMEKAVADAVEAEQKRTNARLEEELLINRARMEEEKQVWLQEAVTRALAERERQAQDDHRTEVARNQEEHLSLIKEAVEQAVVEKDKQMEALIARQQVLVTECQRHRDTIRRLTDGEHVRSGAGTVDPLLERVDNLEKERKELLEELASFREKVAKKETKASGGRKRATFIEDQSGPKGDMAQSIAVMCLSGSGSRDVATSPEHGRLARDKMTKSMRESPEKICLHSCLADDLVLVLWSVEFSSYMVLQESPTLHFLHPDCLDTLCLRPSSDGSPRKLYSIAVVVGKEYCNAKRAENRYRVPQGTKFYRVMVKPAVRERQDSSLNRVPSDGGLLS